MSDRITVNVKGLERIVRDLDAADRHLGKEFRAELKVAGSEVRDDIRDKLERYSHKSAVGYRTRFRTKGAVVSVEQRLRRTTGKRPDWGVTQMRLGVLPAAREDQPKVEKRIRFAVDVALKQLTH